jgi:hypothetical protein
VVYSSDTKRYKLQVELTLENRLAWGGGYSKFYIHMVKIVLKSYVTLTIITVLTKTKFVIISRLLSLMRLLSQGFTNTPRSDIEDYVWSSHKPWVPRPLLSIHVRMGDKACEMKVVEFEEYMHLAHRIRKHFPHLNNVWLSTEMQVYY